MNMTDDISAQVEVDTAPAATRSPTRVWLVDDNEIFLRLCALLLEDYHDGFKSC